MTKKIATPRKVVPSAFNEHARKSMIRKSWCKPQLHELHTTLKSKLVYLGLPDVKGLDILEWIEYLDKVIAFQCSEYKNKKIKVKDLDDLLLRLEREKKINSGFVYQGYMEDIVMGGASERGDTYTQNDYLRIYNLDFCNNLQTPRVTRDRDGKPIKYYKVDIIKRLLEHQLKVSNDEKNRNFIMYLTVSSDTFKISESEIDNKIINAYLKKIGKLTKPAVKAARQMKAYCYFILSKIFREEGFHSEFLPTVYYMGSEYPNKEKGGKLDNHRMMTFTVLGTRRKDNEEFLEQNIEKVLSEKFIWVTNSAISPYKDIHIEETDCEHNSQKVIQASDIFKKYWAPKP